MFELNPQQQNAVKESYKWFKKQNNQVFEISGPAGSGKTSIVNELVKKLNLKHEEVLFMAYVGKAAMALTLKGNYAKTIHSTIYDLVEVPKYDEDNNVIMKNGRVVKELKFVKKKMLDESIKLLVIDEGSMVNETIALDILSFGLPILVLGDLDQLPPVFGNSFFLRKPDIILTQIMRQAEGHPIIYLSQLAKKGLPINYGNYGNMCFVINSNEVSDAILKNADAIICGKNKTRQKINDYYREKIDKVTKKIPVIGDKLVCRQNNKIETIDDMIYLTNGTIGTVEGVYLDTFNKRSICIDFKPEFLQDKYFRKIPIDLSALFTPLTEPSKRSYINKFQFGRAITCHLSQGSQYDNVLIYRERLGIEHYQRKWDYTAITRAVNKLIIVK